MKTLIFVLFLIILNCALAISPEEAEAFPYGGGQLVLSENFDSDFPYNLPEECRLVKIQGTNGTTALKINGNIQGKEGLILPLKGLMENQIYEVKINVRSKNIQNRKARRRNVIFGVEQLQKSDNKIVICDYPVFQEDAEEYREVRLTFQPRPGNNVRLHFNAWHNWTGEVWFDDLEIRSAGVDVSALLRYPSNLTLRDTLRYLEIKCSDTIQQNAAVLIQARQNGVLLENKILEKHKDFVFTSTLPSLKNGPAEITVKVLDVKRKTYLYKGIFNLNVDDVSPVPEYAVTIDKHGRTIINGKPFMPFGVYGLFGDIDLQRIAEAGFNCAQIYASFTMHGNPKTGNPVKDIRNRLDAFAKHNLKLLFSVNQQLPGYFEGAEEFAGARGKVPAAKRVAELFGKHPALLGYYVADEVSRSLVPDIVKLREALRDADPWHPTWSVTYRMNDLPYYGNSADVIGVDPYPISAIPVKPTLDKIVTDMKGARTTGLPIWVVPQIMNYGVYTHKVPEEFKKTRGPNANEMLAMPLLCAILGAKGFIFYSYIAIFLHSERILPGSGAPQWPNVVYMAKQMRSLEKFILSTEEEQKIKVEAIPKDRVMARLFKADDGEYALAVVALGPEPVKAIIQLPPDVPKLKSTLGLTNNLENGKYLFQADAIEADILR